MSREECVRIPNGNAIGTRMIISSEAQFIQISMPYIPRLEINTRLTRPGEIENTLSRVSDLLCAV